jgi:eukaryotic-like serine/threonine-protein kinase
MTAPIIERKMLGNLSPLDEGNEGIIYETDRTIRGLGTAVYKEYKPEVLASLIEPALERAVSLFRSLSRQEATSLLDRAAWPMALIQDSGKTTGFLMPKVPDRFFMTLMLPSGAVERVISGFQYLLDPDNILRNRRININDYTRYLLLDAVVTNLSYLHDLGVAVGDFSHKNLLFSLDGRPTCYFVDCDTMLLGGASPLPQRETPGWRIRDISQETRKHSPLDIGFC